MSWTEFIGFLISMFFILFILLRPGWEARRKQKDPKEYPKEEMQRETRMQTFLKQNHLAVEERKKDARNWEDEIHEEDDEFADEKLFMLKNKRKQESRQRAEKSSNINAIREAQQQRMSTHLKSISTAANTQPPSQYTHQTAPTLKTLRQTNKEQRSRGKDILNHLKSPQEMFVIQEIIGPPKGLQEKPW